MSYSCLILTNILTVHHMVYKQSISLYQYTLKTLGLSAFYTSDINVKISSVNINHIFKSNHKLYVVYIFYISIRKTYFRKWKRKTSSQNIHLLVLEESFFDKWGQTRGILKTFKKKKKLLKFNSVFTENPKKWKCSEKETSELFL